MFFLHWPTIFYVPAHLIFYTGMGIVHTGTMCEIHRQPVVIIPAQVYFHPVRLFNMSSYAGKFVIDNATDWPPVPNRTGVRGRGYFVHDALL